jgi:oligopeptide/dipeptide ABC transporter ATP-binding protein
MNSTLLEVKGLATSFKTDRGRFRAVDDVTFNIAKGESVGLVGESGCGKSVTSLSILRLLHSSHGTIDAGQILFDGNDLLKLTEAQMQKIRGNRISMIFQEPMTSLNPVFTIGEQIAEVFRIHQHSSHADAKAKSIQMLDLVKIPAAASRFSEYPHQLSGGMRQRVMIAMALACKPELLVADEPTTALDVTIQAQILALMSELQKELGMAILLITHDLGVVANMCKRVLVMYGGNIVEQAPVADIFATPKHPYTIGLLQSIPRLGKKVKKLHTIEGSVPPLGEFPDGCKFQNRCSLVRDRCRKEVPPLAEVSKDQLAACWVAQGEA